MLLFEKFITERTCNPMMHPKMQYTYVGIDSHKDSHTAVFLDCFFEKLGEITFENLPSKFGAFLAKAEKLKVGGTTLLFGLEDVSMYGRLLAVYFRDNGQKMKHVNALLVAKERKNRNTTQKTDSIDAECAARVLLSKLDQLPDAAPDDKYWILQSLVTRRDFIVRANISLKNHLHSLITQHYPNYKQWFPVLDSQTSLAFLARYPSPSTLEGATVESLAAFIRKASDGRVGAGLRHTARAQLILDTLQDTTMPFQKMRDRSVTSTLRQIDVNNQEIQQLEQDIESFLGHFNCTLTSMNGIETVTAAQLLTLIGDIRRFPTAAKLARYAGIAPVTYASGQFGKQHADSRGNRQLNSTIYLLAVRLIGSSAGKIVNHFTHGYYHRKLAEGKTKKQALKCVQRRLVNIIWRMLMYNEVYVNPPLVDKVDDNAAKAADKPAGRATDKATSKATDTAIDSN